MFDANISKNISFLLKAKNGTKKMGDKDHYVRDIIDLIIFLIITSFSGAMVGTLFFFGHPYPENLWAFAQLGVPVFCIFRILIIVKKYIMAKNNGNSESKTDSSVHR